jgi:HK97 family phage prohead protease
MAITSSKAILRSVAKRQAKLQGCATSGGCPSIWNYACKLAPTSDTLTLADPAATFIQADEKECSATFVISVQLQDRDGDVVMCRGCQLDNYKRNPVVLLSHDSARVPIGRAMDRAGRLAIQIEDNRILGTCYFDEGDPDAMYLYGKVVRGFLRATSIGFVPIEAERLQEAGNAAFAGWLFRKWELLEFSLVSVPSNPLAVLLNDLKTAHISDSLRKSLEPLTSSGRHSVNGFSAPDLTQQLEALSAIDAQVREKIAGTKQMTEGSAADGGALVEEEHKDNPSSDIARWIFDREQFPSEADAEKWLEANGYDAEATAGDIHGQNAWVFINFAADECVPDSMRQEELADGVRAMVCQRKVEQAKPEIRDMSDAAVKDHDCTCQSKAKGKIDDCVSAKIPKLREEGYEEQQAIAIAERYCREKKDMDVKAASGPESEYQHDDPGDVAETNKSLPHGAHLASAFHKLCKDHMDMMEPNSPMLKWMHKSHAGMCKLVEQHYPHLELGIEPLEGAVDEGDVEETNKGEEYQDQDAGDVASTNKDPGDEDHGDAEAERDDREGDNYYEDEMGSGASGSEWSEDEVHDEDDEEDNKQLAALAIIAKANAKGMAKRHKMMVKEAAEHLDEAARHSETPKLHKAAHRHHSKALQKVLEETDRSTTEGQMQDEGRRSYQGNGKATDERQLNALYAELAGLQEDLYSATARID